MSYTVTITGRDYVHTLPWLNCRGYDGGFYDHAKLVSITLPDGRKFDDADDIPDEVGNRSALDLEKWQVVTSIDAADARKVWDEYQDDPDAFLACCGSPTLSNALAQLLDTVEGYGD